MTTDWVSGSIFIRPIVSQRGEIIVGHKHHFDHTHIVQAGWFLVRGFVNGHEVVHQKAAVEHRRIRNLTPQDQIWRPIRFADRIRNGNSEFVVQFIKQNDPIPEGGTEILYAPTGYHCLIHANVLHDMIALDDGYGLCVYSHREPQGDIALTRTGWEQAYN